MFKKFHFYKFACALFLGLFDKLFSIAPRPYETLIKFYIYQKIK